LSISDFFANPTAWGWGLAFIFGLIWLAFLAPRDLNRVPTWLVFILGAVVMAPCIVWIQIPLQNWVADLLTNWLGQDVLMNNIYLAMIPIILLSGIVQEGAKMIPTVIYWFYKGRSIDPKLGLTIGAMAGAGFGILEAQWVNNLILTSGWTLGEAQTAGFLGFAGFWERFFTVGFHISLGALTGWGLAKGWGWKFYLAAAFIHSFSNYSVVLVQTGKLTGLQIEIIIAVIAVIVFGFIGWLRWKKSDYINQSEQQEDILFY
jgi:RsiW-degrading membrane proteinase PrsW (M82 family)